MTEREGTTTRTAVSNMGDAMSGASGPPPRVSIVLTTLNGARFLRDSIDSCLGQTFADFELIVVDGGSTDGTVEIIESYTDARVRLIHQTDNVGLLPGAINVGLDGARGKYLTWMQDDSLYAVQAIERMVAELVAHSDVGQVYADYDEIDEDGQLIQRHRPLAPELILSARHDALGVCFLIRRDVRLAVGAHDVASFPCQDMDYRIRIARRFASRHIPEALYSWRRQPDSLTGRLGWRKLARTDVAIRRRHGLVSRGEARRDLAEIDMAWAFEEFGRAHWAAVPRFVMMAFGRHPRFALNRGAWSVLARSTARAAWDRRPTAAKAPSQQTSDSA